MSIIEKYILPMFSIWFVVSIISSVVSPSHILNSTGPGHTFSYLGVQYSNQFENCAPITNTGGNSTTFPSCCMYNVSIATVKQRYVYKSGGVYSLENISTYSPAPESMAVNAVASQGYKLC